MRKAFAGLCLAMSIAAPSAAAVAGPALVFEPEKGTVLYSEDADMLWHPASLTKLMTAYLTFEALRQGTLKIDQKIVCSQHALDQPASKLGLPVGGEITVDLALKAVIVKSANDVSVMLAEAVAGNEEAFVERMNQTAGRLGMSRTRFVNPNGLPDDRQVTTARDLAKLARAILADYPEHAPLFALGEVAIGKRRLRTHNGLLYNFAGADGMKTGYICDSGYNVVASATRDGRKVIAVVLGERSGAARTIRAQQLMEHGFKRFTWKAIFSPTLDRLVVDTPLGDGSVTSLRQDLCGGGTARVRGRSSPRPRIKTTPMTAAVSTSEEVVPVPAAKPATVAPVKPAAKAGAKKVKKPAASATAAKARKKAPKEAAASAGAARKPTRSSSVN